MDTIKMTRAEAARACNVTTKTIDRWVATGKVEAEMSEDKGRVLLIPQDLLNGSTDTNEESGKSPLVNNDITMKELADMDIAGELTFALAITYDQITTHILRAREKLGLIEAPEKLHEREEVVSQTEEELKGNLSALSEREKAIVEREADVEKIIAKAENLQDMIDKAVQIRQWCVDTVEILQSSEVWKDAYNEEQSELPEWPRDVDIDDIIDWVADVTKPPAKKKLVAKEENTEEEFSDDEDWPKDEE